MRGIAKAANGRAGLPARPSLTLADGLRPSLAYGLLATVRFRDAPHAPARLPDGAGMNTMGARGQGDCAARQMQPASHPAARWDGPATSQVDDVPQPSSP